MKKLIGSGMVAATIGLLVFGTAYAWTCTFEQGNGQLTGWKIEDGINDIACEPWTTGSRIDLTGTDPAGPETDYTGIGSPAASAGVRNLIPASAPVHAKDAACPTEAGPVLPVPDRMMLLASGLVCMLAIGWRRPAAAKVRADNYRG